MRVLMLMVAALILTGCVSQSAVLVNSAGQTTFCRAQGWGYIGAPMAMSQQKKCLKAAHDAGYSEPLPH